MAVYAEAQVEEEENVETRADTVCIKMISITSLPTHLVEARKLHNPKRRVRLLCKARIVYPSIFSFSSPLLLVPAPVRSPSYFLLQKIQSCFE